MKSPEDIAKKLMDEYCNVAQPPPLSQGWVQEFGYAIASAIQRERDVVHNLLDEDESEIIRNAKDGYPEGRKDRVLTLEERIKALCKYASDWKRWFGDAENKIDELRNTTMAFEVSDQYIRSALAECVEALEMMHPISSDNCEDCEKIRTDTLTKLRSLLGKDGE